jgi:hypothetical protein
MLHILPLISSFHQQIMKQKAPDVSDKELKSVIADFLDMGHVENIVAMFRHEDRYYSWVGELLHDERFSVRLGLSVLLEELKETEPVKLPLSIPSLVKLTQNIEPLYRGEALSVLAIVGTDEAMAFVKKSLKDKDPQVREMAELLLEDEV